MGREMASKELKGTVARVRKVAMRRKMTPLSQTSSRQGLWSGGSREGKSSRGAGAEEADLGEASSSWGERGE